MTKESLTSRMAAAGRGVLWALPLFLAGCIEKQTEGSLTIIQFESWVPLVMTAAGIGFILASVLMFKRSKWVAALLMFLGIGGAVVLGPGLFGDSVKVDAQHFQLKTGFWFSPTRHEVRFDELASIELIVEKRRSGRGTNTSHYLLCNSRSGEERKVPIGDLMRPARDLILANAQARGVPVIDRTGGQ